jgi:hypothetical protein
MTFVSGQQQRVKLCLNWPPKPGCHDFELAPNSRRRRYVRRASPEIVLLKAV